MDNKGHMYEIPAELLGQESELLSKMHPLSGEEAATLEKLRREERVNALARLRGRPLAAIHDIDADERRRLRNLLKAERRKRAGK